MTREAIDPVQHFTKPPARFSEASLVKELENAVSVVRPPMRQLFPPFRTAVM